MGRIALVTVGEPDGAGSTGASSPGLTQHLVPGPPTSREAFRSIFAQTISATRAQPDQRTTNLPAAQGSTGASSPGLMPEGQTGKGKGAVPVPARAAPVPAQSVSAGPALGRPTAGTALLRLMPPLAGMPAALRAMSAEQLRVVVEMVMDEWRRRDGLR